MKVIILVLLISASFFSTPSYAGSSGDGSGGSPSFGCLAAGEFMADAAAFALARGGWTAGGIGGAVAAGLAGVTTKYGPSAISAICNDLNQPDGYTYYGIVRWLHDCDMGPCLPIGPVEGHGLGIDVNWMATTILNAYDPNDNTQDLGFGGG